MMVILLMINMKEQEKYFMIMKNIIQDNLRMDLDMELENYFIKMEILNMMVIGLIINMKEQENYFMKMENIMMGNLKMD